MRKIIHLTSRCNKEQIELGWWRLSKDAGSRFPGQILMVTDVKVDMKVLKFALYCNVIIA